LQRLAAPAPPPPPPKPLTLAEMQQQLLQRVQPAVEAAWPTEIPLQSFDLQLSPAGAVVDVQYASRRDLDPISLALIERQLQQQLALPALTLKAKRDPNSLRILEEARKKAQQAASAANTAAELPAKPAVK
jgi:hypothetical protein